jgi:hypothetical protein
LTIMLCKWELSNNPLKDFKFSFSILKIKKHSMWFGVSVILKYFSLKGTNTARDFFHRKVKIFPVQEIRHQRINICLQRVIVR